MQRPTALNAGPMENNFLSCGNADGDAHADAKAVHAVNQKLHLLRNVREEDNIIGTAQKWKTMLLLLQIAGTVGERERDSLRPFSQPGS